MSGKRVVESGHLTNVDENEIFDLVRQSMQRFAEKLDLEKLVNLRWPVV